MILDELLSLENLIQSGSSGTLGGLLVWLTYKLKNNNRGNGGSHPAVIDKELKDLERFKIVVFEKFDALQKKVEEININLAVLSNVVGRKK